MSELDHIIRQIPFVHLQQMLAGLDALDARSVGSGHWSLDIGHSSFRTGGASA
jgi:hypothetical protein